MFLPDWALFLLVVGAAAILLGHAFIMREGFQAGLAGVRCGVDLATCSVGTKCLNGFCQNTDVPRLPANDLPVYP